jgi:PGF-pre-PGF domain-containing protein
MNNVSKKTIVVIFLALLMAMPAAAISPSSERILPDSVNTGEQFNVTINVSDYGSFAMVNETLPEGFTFVDMVTDDNINVNETGQYLLFHFFSLDNFTYTLTAPSSADTYNFDGYLNDSTTSIDINGSQSLKVNAVSDPDDTSSSSSGGGGGGGGATGEAFENIASKYAQLRTVSIGADIRYEFDESDIMYVNFKGNTNSGQVKVLIEVLKDTSTLVDEDVPGQAYRHINIWVGNSAFDEDNMEDPVVGFRVSKDWLSDNGVDPSSVSLFHYYNGWEQLVTTQTDEDDDYFYFEAEATAFSPFAISAVTEEAVSEEETDQDADEPATDEEETVEEPSADEEDKQLDNSVPGFSSLLMIGIIGSLYALFRKEF